MEVSGMIEKERGLFSVGKWPFLRFVFCILSALFPFPVIPVGEGEDNCHASFEWICSEKNDNRDANCAFLDFPQGNFWNCLRRRNERTVAP